MIDLSGQSGGQDQVILGVACDGVNPIGDVDEGRLAAQKGDDTSKLLGCQLLREVGIAKHVLKLGRDRL